DPEALGVVGGCFSGGEAAVVGVAWPGLAEHSPSAPAAGQGGAEPGGGVGLRGGGRARGGGSFAGVGDLPGGEERFFGGECVVCGLCGPYPLVDGVDLSVAAFGGAPVPHHVPGVFRVVQDFVDGGLGPFSGGAGGDGGLGRRVAYRVVVEHRG